MSLLEKLQPLLILAAVLLGLSLGAIPHMSDGAGHFILPLLMLMLTGVFLQVPLKRFAGAFRYRRVALASLIINFAWTPIFAWVLGWLFLHDQPALWIGLLMLLVTPCTDWYIVFTAVARGHVVLSTALLPVNLVLQLLLLPVYLAVLAGAVLPINLGLIARSVALVLVLPLLAATVLRPVMARSRETSFLKPIRAPFTQTGQFLFLALAIAAMFASEGGVILRNPQVLLLLLPPLLVFFALNMVLAFGVSKSLKTDYESFASLCCTTLARNSPIALAVALAAFPEQPLIALSLVIGPLIELPVLGMVAQALLWIRRRGVFERAVDF